MSNRIAWTFARRELRAGVRGFRVFLACLALGVGAIATAGTIREAVVAGVSRDARALLGGDLEIGLAYRAATEDERAAMQDLGTVSHIVSMRSMAARDDDPVRRTLVELKAVDDAYPLFGNVILRSGANIQEKLKNTTAMPPVVVEDTLLSRLDLAVGDALRLGETAFQIAGVITKEPDKVTTFATFGPRAMISMEAMAATNLVQPGALVRHDYRLGLDPGMDADTAAEALRTAFPDAGWRIKGLEQAASGLENFFANLTLFLGLVGLTALLVGGIGVSNAVRAYLAGRVHTIAALKCAGAAGSTVFSTYAILIGVLGLSGVVLGTIVGAAVPALALWLAGDLLPVPADIRLYPVPLAWAALFGLLTTAVFSLPALGRAMRTPPTSLFRSAVDQPHVTPPRWSMPVALGLAMILGGLVILTAASPKLAFWFLVGTGLAMLLFLGLAEAAMGLAKRLASLTRGRPSLRLALANLHRPGSGAASVVLSLGLGLSVLVAVGLVEANMNRGLQEQLPEQAPSFFFIDIQPDDLDRFHDTISTIEGFESMETASMVRGRITHIDGVPADQASVAPEAQWALRGDRGLTSRAVQPPDAVMVRGAWWPEDYAGPPLVSLDANIASGMGLEVGDTITINILGRAITAELASTRDINWASLSINFTFIFSPGVIEAAPHTYIATVRAAPEAEVTIDRAVAEAFPAITAIRVKEALLAVQGIITASGTAIRVTGLVGVIAGALVLAGAMAAGRQRRVLDSVVLKVLGATRADVLRTFLLEYGVLGVATAGIAAVVGSVGAWATVTTLIPVGWELDLVVVGSIVLGCLVLTLGAGYASTRHALITKPAPYLRND